MYVWVALLITPSSFYREGQGSFLSSPKSHGDRGIPWTCGPCPEEAGVGREAQTCPWNRSDPP